MVRLPALVFTSQVKGARVLEVCRENNGFIPCLARELDAQVPAVERYKGKLEVFWQQVLLSEGVKGGDGISKGARVPDVLPRQGGEACCAEEEERWSAHESKTYARNFGGRRRAYCTGE